jgi:hypothetical protein
MRGSTLPVIVLGVPEEPGESADAGANYRTKPFGRRIARPDIAVRATSATALPATTLVWELTIDLMPRAVGMDIRRTDRIRLTGNAGKKTRVSYARRIARQCGAQWGPVLICVYFGRIQKMGTEAGSLLETIPGLGYILHSSLSS